jgi:hypothetical protein
LPATTPSKYNTQNEQTIALTSVIGLVNNVLFYPHTDNLTQTLRFDSRYSGKPNSSRKLNASCLSDVKPVHVGLRRERKSPAIAFPHSDNPKWSVSSLSQSAKSAKVTWGHDSHLMSWRHITIVAAIKIHQRNWLR